MKILQINCVYRKGSTGKIVYDIHTGLMKNGYQSVVCYGRGAKAHEENVYKSSIEVYSKFHNLRSRFTGIMYGGCFFSTNRLIRIIKLERPDVVHLHCLNGYFVNIYRLIEFLKNVGIKTVLTLHAEFMHTGNCGYAFECEKWKTGCGECPRLRQETRSYFFDNTALSWKKMKKAFDGFDNLIVTSVSPWLQLRAECSPILMGKRHETVLNGIDTSVFHVYENSKIKQELGIVGKKIVFHVTAGFSTDREHIKGGYYVVEVAKRFLETDPDVVFLVAGAHEKLIDIPPNMVFLGNIADQSKLAEYYSISDVTLLTSKKETFSMVVAESLCCGTPIVGFEAGAPEMITIEDFSCFVQHGDVDQLYEATKKYLGDIQEENKKVSQAAISKYNKDAMIAQYQAIYHMMMNDVSL